MTSSWKSKLTPRLRLRLRKCELKRELRSLEKFYLEKKENAESDREENAIHAEWAHEAQQPEGELLWIESREVLKAAKQLDLVTPKPVQDTYSGQWRFSDDDIRRMRLSIRKERRDRRAAFIQSFVMPLIGLFGALAAVLSLLPRCF